MLIMSESIENTERGCCGESLDSLKRLLKSWISSSGINNLNLQATAFATETPNATANVSLSDNILKFSFGIPRGLRGKDGINGINGKTPYIKDGYWWIGDTNTGVLATGPRGEQGIPGENVGSGGGLTKEEVEEIIKDAINKGDIIPDEGNYGGYITLPIYKITTSNNYGSMPINAKWSGSSGVICDNWNGWSLTFNNVNLQQNYLWISFGTFNTNTGLLEIVWSSPIPVHNSTYIPNPDDPDSPSGGEDRGAFTDTLTMDYAFYLTTEDTNANNSLILKKLNDANREGKRIDRNSFEGTRVDNLLINDWVDNTQGVNAIYTKEYMAFSLIIEHRDENGVKTGETVTAYQGPVLVNHWGESGVDGDGVQYIFTRTKTNTPPDSLIYDGEEEDLYKAINKYPTWDENGEYIANGVTWTDDPKGVDLNIPYEWVSIRKYRYDKIEHKKKWTDFSEPAIWAKYAADGVGQYLVQVFMAVKNKDFADNDNTHIPHAPIGGTWNISNNIFTEYPTRSIGDIDNDNIIEGWSLSDKFDSDEPVVIYRSQAYFNALGSLVAIPDNDGHQITWSTPLRLTGVDGRPGTDGTSIEFIYLNTLATTSVEDIKNDTEFGSGLFPANGEKFPSVGNYKWLDHPKGVSEEMPIEWVAQRKLVDTVNGKQWSKYSIPSKWSVFGKVGTDGDGVEYIFCVTNGSEPYNDPSLLPADQEDDYTTSWIEWTDDPSPLTEEYYTMWCCIRWFKHGEWTRFTKPKLWARLGDKGIPGLTLVNRYCYTTEDYRDNLDENCTGTRWQLEVGTDDNWRGKDIYVISAYFSGNNFATSSQGAPYYGWSTPRISASVLKLAKEDFARSYIYGTNEDLTVKADLENYLNINFSDSNTISEIERALNIGGTYPSGTTNAWVKSSDVGNLKDKAWLWELTIWFDGELGTYESHWLRRITPKDGDNTIDYDTIINGVIDNLPEGTNATPVMIYYNTVGTVQNLDYRISNNYPPTGWSKLPQKRGNNVTTWYAIGILSNGELLKLDDTNYWSAPAFYDGYTQIATGPTGPQGLQGIDGLPGVDMLAVYGAYRSSMPINPNALGSTPLQNKIKGVIEDKLMTPKENDIIDFLSLSYGSTLEAYKKYVADNYPDEKFVLGKDFYIHVFNINREYNIEYDTDNNGNKIEVSRDANYTYSNSGVVNGTVGEQGHTGLILYPEGVWIAKNYTQSDTSTPYVLYEGNFYLLNAPTASSTEIPGQSDKWKKLESMESLYSKYALFGAGAFGSMCFYGRWMFSQQGIKNGNASSAFNEFTPNSDVFPTTGFIPNFAVNCNTGAVYLNNGINRFNSNGSASLGNGTININSNGTGYIGSVSSPNRITWDNNGNVKVSNIHIYTSLQSVNKLNGNQSNIIYLDDLGIEDGDDTYAFEGIYQIDWVPVTHSGTTQNVYTLNLGFFIDRFNGTAEDNEASVRIFVKDVKYNSNNEHSIIMSRMDSPSGLNDNWCRLTTYDSKMVFKLIITRCPYPLNGNSLIPVYGYNVIIDKTIMATRAV